MPKELRPARGALTIYGLNELQDMLAGLRARIADPEPVLEMSMRALELSESHLFSRLAPRFHETGATMESLTQPDARGAIREIHGVYLKFGTSMWYSKFLRRIGGPSGKPRGRKRVGPNLVLKINAADRRAALQEMGRYLLVGR